MYDLTRSESCSMHASSFGESRIPSAKTCVLFGRSEMTLRDARGVVMEKESREARQSARNNVIL